MSIQQVRPFGLGGFGVFSSYFSLSSILNYFERIFYIFKKKKVLSVDLGEEAFQLFNISPMFSIHDFFPTPFLESTKCFYH